jgi:hypothetical protein
VDYGPTSLEVDFIHQSSHQVDAAAMRRLKLPHSSWVREIGAVKPRPFVPDHNENFLIGHTAAVDVNMLARVFVIAVNDAICQGFPQGDFNVNFVSRNTLAFLYEDHELVYEWRNRRDFTSNGLLYLEERAGRVQNTGRRSRLRLFAHFFSILSGREKARWVPNQWLS